MTQLPTGDGTFWTRDKVLCLNSLRKWRSVDVVAGVSWAGQDAEEGEGAAARREQERSGLGASPSSATSLGFFLETFVCVRVR